MTTKILRQCYRRYGDEAPQTLELVEEEIELKESTDVLIEVKAVALNYRDANILNGTNPWAVSPSGTPCSDASGIIIAVGRSVTRFAIGDKVCPIFDQQSITGLEQSREWLGGEVDGVLATHVIFPEEKVVKFPDHLSWAEAACLPCAGLTAWNALAYDGSLTAGKTVLIQGTGGVSLMALKLARTAGCKVIITSSSDAKLEAVEGLSGIGQISTINYLKNPNWDIEAVRINGGVGADVVIENGGTPSLLKSINAAAKRGVVSQVGYLGYQNPQDLDGLLSGLIDKSITLSNMPTPTKEHVRKAKDWLAENPTES
ncbi:hypothetical protein B7463_g11380, partial [Scytalidium lignicola]